MTAHVADRKDPDDPADDATWWDRHGWDGGSAGDPSSRVRAPGPDLSDPQTDDSGTEDPDGPRPAGVRWSTLLTAVVLLGGLITLPVLGLAGGFGRVLAPTAWALLGLAVGLRLSDREPTWDLSDLRRVEPLIGWGLGYAVTALAGLRWYEGVPGWWVPGTVATALMPFVFARARPVAALHRSISAARRTRRRGGR